MVIKRFVCDHCKKIYDQKMDPIRVYVISISPKLFCVLGLKENPNENEVQYGEVCETCMFELFPTYPHRNDTPPEAGTWS
jgi:hypothetical protein